MTNGNQIVNQFCLRKKPMITTFPTKLSRDQGGIWWGLTQNTETPKTPNDPKHRIAQNTESENTERQNTESPISPKDPNHRIKFDLEIDFFTWLLDFKQN